MFTSHITFSEDNNSEVLSSKAIYCSMVSQKPAASLSAHLWTLHRITGAQRAASDHCGALPPMWESNFIQGTENIGLP